MLTRTLTTTATAARRLIIKPLGAQRLCTAPVPRVVRSIIPTGITTVASTAFSSMADPGDRHQGPAGSAQEMDGNEQEYIAFDNDGSDSESDLEIDLATKPAKSSSARHPKVPKHFRKSNAKVYDNISVYAPPDSLLIFRCSQKRANWYLSRNLARSLSPTSIHLNFSPAGQGHAHDSYYLEERENNCVICGQATAEAGATMLHVVPEQYRKWFPLRLKSHSSHDVVVACPECNAHWDREAAVVRRKIVDMYNVPLEGVGWIKDYEAGVAKRAAGAVVADWSRQWQEHHDKQQRRAFSIGSADSQESSSIPPAAQPDVQDAMKGKKAKGKKQNVIPRERMQVLEKNVSDWWDKTYKTDTEESSQLKRDMPAEFSVESQDSRQEAMKKLKSEDSSVGSIVSQRAKASDIKHIDSIEIPMPPPGHSTNLSRAILEAALAAQATYKGPEYREHGQLVIARVMASSPEFHADKEESDETIQLWKDGVPLDPAPQGWRDVTEFVRSWRREFLERVKPRHLSTEWRVENPV